MKKLKLLFLSLPFLVLLIGIGLATGTVPHVAAQELSTDFQHCIVRLEPIRPGEQSSKVSEPICFDNSPDAIALITGGRIRLPQTAQQAEIDEAMRSYSTSSSLSTGSTNTLLSSFLIARFWNNINFNNLLVEYMGPVSCSPSTSYGVPVLSSSLNDKFESGSAYSSCNILWIYENINYGGQVGVCYPSCSDFGIFKNQVSSWRATP